MIYKNNKCSETKCFGCYHGECLVLSNTQFKNKNCPFYKTTDKYLNETFRYSPSIRELYRSKKGQFKNKAEFVRYLLNKVYTIGNYQWKIGGNNRCHVGEPQATNGICSIKK